MSRTLRIYNNPRLKKCQRYNLDDIKKSENGIIMHVIIGIPYTKRSWVCMGRCPMCRDRNREPALLRKRRKEQFRFELKEEMAS